MEHNSSLILPGDPEFDFTLGICLPPGWQEFAYSNPGFAFVARSDTGLLEPVSEEDLEEYIEGGEWDKRLEQLGEDIYDYADLL